MEKRVASVGYEMAVLSRRTLAVAIRCLENLPRTSIEALFYELQVPDELFDGKSKKSLLLNAFAGLEKLGRHDLLRSIVFEAATRCFEQDKPCLQDALMKDGFVLGGAELAPDVPQGEENRSALQSLIERNGDRLSSKVLAHHLEESTDLFRQEKWDSSIGQARNFVEQLLLDIACVVASAVNKKPDLSRPARVRDYLVSAGFFDKVEREKLVDGVYGYLSDNGSHPGISTQSCARVCIHVSLALGFYLLEKMEAWSSRNSRVL